MPKFPFLSLKLFGMVLLGLGLFQLSESLIEPRHSLLFLSLAALLLLLPGFFPSLRKSYQQVSAFSILAFVCVVWIFYSFCQLHKGIHNPSYFKSEQSSDTLMVWLNEYPIKKRKSYKINAHVYAKKRMGEWQHASGKVMLYFEMDSAQAAQLKYGDMMVLHAAFAEIDEPKNPNQFDFKRYCRIQNIFHQAYVPRQNWKLLDENMGNGLKSFALGLRHHWLDKLRESGFREKEFAVAGALLLGYKDEIDKETLRAYSSAGAMHVLAISGLHVGIIFLMFNTIFKFLLALPRGKIIRSVVVLSLIWLYALVAGFSPSVVRASVMFSAVALAQAANRKTNIYNTLLISAVVLITFDPQIIFQVGFQLSYAAVLGIVSVQPALDKLLKPKTKLGKAIWGIITVSIAAQLATFPFGLYYFHQFPNLFILSNLLVIPLVTLILYLGVPLLLLSMVFSLPTWLFAILSGLIHWMNRGVSWIESLPNSLLYGLHIEDWQLWLLMAGIALGVVALKVKSRNVFAASFALLFGVQMGGLMRYWESQNRREIVLYNTTGALAMDLTVGRENVFLYSNALAEDEAQMLFTVKHNWWARNIFDSQLIAVDELGQVQESHWKVAKNRVQLGEISLALGMDDYHNSDWLLLHEMFGKVDIDQLKTQQPKGIILHTGLRRKWKEQVYEALAEAQVPILDLEKGYVVLRSE